MTISVIKVTVMRAIIMKLGTFMECLLECQGVWKCVYENDLFLPSQTSDAIDIIHSMLQDCH